MSLLRYFSLQPKPSQTFSALGKKSCDRVQSRGGSSRASTRKLTGFRGISPRKAAVAHDITSEASSEPALPKVLQKTVGKGTRINKRASNDENRQNWAKLIKIGNIIAHGAQISRQRLEEEAKKGGQYRRQFDYLAELHGGKLFTSRGRCQIATRRRDKQVSELASVDLGRDDDDGDTDMDRFLGEETMTDAGPLSEPSPAFVEQHNPDMDWTAEIQPVKQVFVEDSQVEMDWQPIISVGAAAPCAPIVPSTPAAPIVQPAPVGTMSIQTLPSGPVKSSAPAAPAAPAPTFTIQTLPSKPVASSAPVAPLAPVTPAALPAVSAAPKPSAHTAPTKTMNIQVLPTKPVGSFGVSSRGSQAKAVQSLTPVSLSQSKPVPSSQPMPVSTAGPSSQAVPSVETGLVDTAEEKCQPDEAPRRSRNYDHLPRTTQENLRKLDAEEDNANADWDKADEDEEPDMIDVVRRKRRTKAWAERRKDLMEVSDPDDLADMFGKVHTWGSG